MSYWPRYKLLSGAVEEGGEEAVALEGYAVGRGGYAVGRGGYAVGRGGYAVGRGGYAGESAEAAIAEEVGGCGGGEDPGGGEVVEDGFEGRGGDVGVGRKGGQDIGDDVFVFLGLEGAGGVEEVASGGEAGEGGREDFALTGSLTGKIGRLKTLFYLRVAA
jgi:hypothetical protein